MYFIIGTGVLALTSLSLGREVYKLHKKLMESDKISDRRMNGLKAATFQIEGNKRKINRTEAALVVVKESLRIAEEKVIVLEREKKELNEQVEIFKDFCGKDKTEIGNLQMYNANLKENLEKAKAYHDKVNAEIKRVKSESEALNANIDLILNGSREIRRDFVKNGMKNIELYR